MLEIRQALTMSQKEREELKKTSPEVLERVQMFWNGGKICGQCKHFSQIGTREGRVKNTGMNGSCGIAQRSQYVKPEDERCSQFISNH